MSIRATELKRGMQIATVDRYGVLQDDIKETTSAVRVEFLRGSQVIFVDEIQFARNSDKTWEQVDIPLGMQQIIELVRSLKN